LQSSFTKTQREIWTRNWHNYSREKLVGRLREIDWNSEIEMAQDHYNWLEHRLIEIIDELAPLTLRKCVNVSSYQEKSNVALVNKHRRLIAKWKKKHHPEHRREANELKKQIRTEANNNRRIKVRRHIKPGNPKSLWDAVKIAKDEDTSSIPSKMKWKGKDINREAIAGTFASHCRKKWKP
jgi:hypothetical protein